jgi:hypothetical protein
LKKIAPKSFGQYFLDKNAPNAKKYCPSAEILPNLATRIETSYTYVGETKLCPQVYVGETKLCLHVCVGETKLYPNYL